MNSTESCNVASASTPVALLVSVPTLSSSSIGASLIHVLSLVLTSRSRVTVLLVPAMTVKVDTCPAVAVIPGSEVPVVLLTGPVAVFTWSRAVEGIRTVVSSLINLEDAQWFLVTAGFSFFRLSRGKYILCFHSSLYSLLELVDSRGFHDVLSDLVLFESSQKHRVAKLIS